MVRPRRARPDRDDLDYRIDGAGPARLLRRAPVQARQAIFGTFGEEGSGRSRRSG